MFKDRSIFLEVVMYGYDERKTDVSRFRVLKG